MPEALPADAILKELTALWVSQGKEAQTQEGAGVLRACTMTLIVLAEESEDISELGETIAALMPEHPARAIVVRLGGVSEAKLEQRVYAQCWKPFGQRRQICCEQIEIKASDASLSGLPWVVLPLAVADLPVIVWCRSTRLLGMTEFSAIGGMAHKVIVDSSTMGADGLRVVASLIQKGLLTADLSWTRLTRWREMLAQVFENRDNLAHIANIRRVSVNFSDQAPPVNWYMGAWISNALSEAGVHPQVSVGHAMTDSNIAVMLEGDGFHLELRREEDRMKVSINGLGNCTSLPRPTECLLMREELGIARRDPVYEQTVASAARLAYPNER